MTWCDLKHPTKTLLDEFEGQLKQAVFDINEEWREMGVADLKDRLRKVAGIHTLKVQPGAIVINNQTIPIAATATDDDIAQAIQNNLNKINSITTEKPIMSSALDRIRQKALLARNVAPDAMKAVEADLDSLIAEKATIDAKRVAAVAPHKEAIEGVKGQMDDLKSAIDILSNGAPE